MIQSAEIMDTLVVAMSTVWQCPRVRGYGLCGGGKGFNCEAERTFRPEDIAGAFERAKASKKTLNKRTYTSVAQCITGQENGHHRLKHVNS
ncbi:hypothetical protein LI031_18285 [Enterocloster citroniae]|uniref:hypothetical protein n=1 Tax=Enterocloster citroniae TaxID=358743 RepID=UPI001D062F20|nr:hypothetical protein [Enterocloster citroniae]MCB7065804.1 hypothetical protein [Enterocloster citroniae]